MSEKLIFISCGQLTDEEKQIGLEVGSYIDSISGFKSYLAESVQDLTGLSDSIFNGLRQCSGFISFLHPRGSVILDNGNEWGIRSSVWINQEIAILAYRKYFEGTDIPILVFKDSGVQIEGAMTSLIVNPKPFKKKEEMLEEVKYWIQSAQFSPPRRDDLFKSKWGQLECDSLKVIGCIIDEGCSQVKEDCIRKCMMNRFSFSSNDASHAIRRSKLMFQNTDLVKMERNSNTGDEMSLNETWKWHILREINRIQST